MTTRAEDLQRTIQQLEQLADDRLKEGQAEASRLRSLADDLARRESIRIEAEQQSRNPAFEPGGICGGF